MPAEAGVTLCRYNKVAEARLKDRLMKRFLYLLLFAILIRLLILPLTSTTDADAVSRTFIAWRWLENPHLISYSGWGPLHFYLIAGALKLWFDPVILQSFCISCSPF
jgi:hypothetical protein